MIGSINLIQKEDSCSSEICQHLEIEVRDAGGGPYLCFKTKEWAIDMDDIDMFIIQLKSLLEQYKPEELFND